MDPYRRKHVFYSSCRIIPISPSSEFLPVRSGKLKGAFNSMRRRPSASSLNNASESSGSEATRPRVYPFQFDLPQSCRSGEELPPTYIPTQERSNNSKLASSGSFGVEYKLQVAWEPTEASEYPSLWVSLSQNYLEWGTNIPYSSASMFLYSTTQMQISNPLTASLRSIRLG